MSRGRKSRLLKPGGRIGVVVPALREEPEGVEPRHWTRSGAVEVEAADWQPDGRRDWPRWSEVCAMESPSEFMAGMARGSVELPRADEGRALGFARVVGRRTA
ncbi:hypothetical protein SHO565_13540 [Streptomyces sp. HO565]